MIKNRVLSFEVYIGIRDTEEEQINLILETRGLSADSIISIVPYYGGRILKVFYKEVI
jgi:hypothetical protein